MDLIKSNITWVGCWWDLGRDPLPYQQSLCSIMKLPINMVIFVQTGQEEFINKIQQQIPYQVKLKLIQLDQLPLNFPIDEVTRKYHHNPNPHFNPNKDTPLYCLLQSNKFSLLSLAIKDNYFNTEYFGWLDLGLGRLTDLSSLVKLEHWVNIKTKSLKRRVRFCLIKTTGLNATSPRDSFYKLAHGYIVSGLFLGSAQSITRLSDLFNKEVNNCYHDGIITLEEKILMYLYTKCPQLFSFHFGDYADCLINWVTGINNIRFLIYFLERENDQNMSKKRIQHLWKGALLSGDINNYNKYAIKNPSLSHRAVINYGDLNYCMFGQDRIFQLIKQGITSNYLAFKYDTVIIMMINCPDNYLLSLARNLAIKNKVIWITKRQQLSDLSFIQITGLDNSKRNQTETLINPVVHQIDDYETIDWSPINTFTQRYSTLLVYNPLGHFIGVTQQYLLVNCNKLTYM